MHEQIQVTKLKDFFDCLLRTFSRCPSPHRSPAPAYLQLRWLGVVLLLVYLLWSETSSTSWHVGLFVSIVALVLVLAVDVGVRCDLRLPSWRFFVSLVSVLVFPSSALMCRMLYWLYGRKPGCGIWNGINFSPASASTCNEIGL